jgi:hypothetical protein
MSIMNRICPPWVSAVSRIPITGIQRIADRNSGASKEATGLFRRIEGPARCWNSKKLHADLGRVEDVDEHRNTEKEEKPERDEYGDNEPGELAAVEKERRNFLEVQVYFRNNERDPVNLIKHRVRSESEHSDEPDKPPMNDDIHVRFLLWVKMII